MATKKLQILDSLIKQAENADTLDGKHADEFAAASDVETLKSQVGDDTVSDQINTALLNSQTDWNQTDETQLDYIKNKPDIKPLPDSDNDLLQLSIGNYTCLSAEGQTVYMDYWDEEIQGSNFIYYELEYGNTVSIYKYSDGVDAENDAICYKIRTFKEHVDVKTDLYRNEVKSIEVNELEHFYSIDHLDLTISEVEQIVRECHTNHKPLVIVKGKMRYLCNQVHLLGTGNQYLVFIFTNYDGSGLTTVYRNQYLRDTTSLDRSTLATAEQTPYTIQFTKGTSTYTPV